MPRESLTSRLTWGVAHLLGRLPAPRRVAWLALLLLLPALGVRVFTSLWPLTQTAWISLTNKSAYNPTEFVGLANYRRAFASPEVRGSVGFTVWFAVASTVIELVVGFFLATLLNRRFRGQRLARTVFLLPWAIPAIVTALGFRFMFSDGFGIIPHLLGFVGVETSWLTDPGAARWAVILANAWRSIPFIAIIFLAGLQGIPAELYEAAEIDGANSFQVVRRIVLPLITPLVLTMGLFMVVFQLGSFDIILGMTGGGPGLATKVLSYVTYQEAFLGLNDGRAAAYAMLLFGLVLIVGGAVLAISRRFEHEL